MRKMKTGAELIDSFETWIKNQGKSENTVTTYKGVLRKFYQWLIDEKGRDISEITREDIQEYMVFLEENQNRSASTIDKVFATIRVFTQFLNKPELVQNIKKKEKEKNIYQKTPQPLSKSEKINLLEKVEKDGNIRNTAIIHTLLFTGVRISELCNLDYSDIEIRDQKGIVIVKDASGQQLRIIPLSKKAINHLQEYIQSTEIQEGPLFVSNSNQRLTTRAVQYMLNNYDINPLKLRHTFCQDLIDKGVDTSTVAQLAGHRDINMTKRYKRHVEKDIVNQAFA